MDSNGYVLLHRKIIDWEWWDDLKTSRLFETLIMLANHKAADWHGITIKRGQLIASQDSMAEKAHLTRQSVRTSLNKLKSTNEITIKSTRHFSLITINKYNEFQAPWDIESTNNLTNNLTINQPTANQQLTTNNNDNNENKIIYPPVLPAEKPLRRENGKHLFKHSPYFELKQFSARLENWPVEKIAYYHQAAIDYSDANGTQYLNWIAAVKNWDRRRPDEWKKNLPNQSRLAQW